MYLFKDKTDRQKNDHFLKKGETSQTLKMLIQKHINEKLIAKISDHLINNLVFLNLLNNRK